jgi:hypothetical protein
MLQTQQKMFEAWQIGDAYSRWCALGRPLRFGQWFMNEHHLEGHSKLFYEQDSKAAKIYILNITL